MKTIKLLSLGLFLSGAMLFSSCKKEGCTNPDADNYDASANISDKSCLYTTDVIFWLKEDQSNSLVNDDIKKVDFYLNEEFLGNASTESFWDEAPTCDSTNVIRFSKELQKSNSEPFYYYVKDDEGFTLFQGLTELDTDSCRVILLEGY
ncbi:hypothetical protein [Brumimicrobium aurantiacum]|uniref:Lipoprotein n=1 Tax=Brumimicrobium aurantiacum TaxID=1737063 RepID=A0A3E1EXM0_9FLAO|nr:hypothetical protein [Brumimicrobium aurantiacum]RFC54294.1 hypothetical protein DXU93_07650 [Brumimicrobium aurantiacum]